MCLDRALVPGKRVWLGLAARLGLRRTTGLRKLKKEVKTCEYRDVHVMWEMLRTTDTPMPMDQRDAAAAGGGGAAAAAASAARRRKAAWRRLAYYCCAF